MFRALLAASVLATAAFGVTAHAQDGNSTSVSTRDIDFNKPSDVKRLYSRIHSAADEVCQPGGANNVATARAAEACSTEAIRHAVHDVNQSQLTQLAQARIGNDTQMAARDHRDDNRDETHYASR